MGLGQAMGLSFSVPDTVKLPPSLRNIFKELKNDLDIDKSFTCGDLTSWAQQGVLLLNRALTVRQAKPNSHQKKWGKLYVTHYFDAFGKYSRNCFNVMGW